jgi:nitric oxide synthase oxygenase domain/subunit
VTSAAEIFEECKEHMKLGANGGIIQSLMTIFPPRKPNEKWGTRFWNSQFCRYAGYKQPDGSILGDPANADLTELCIKKLGWQPPAKRTQFDPLPQVIQTSDATAPMVFDMPRELVLEIPLSHPK